jgi:hypothetical protein
VDRSGLYLALVVVALIVAVWLVFQILGLVFQLLFFSLIALVGVAAWRAWRRSAPGAG